MQLLLDTHIVIWMASRPEKLSNTQKSVLAQAGNELFVSVVAAYEYEHLRADGRLPVRRSFDEARVLIGFTVLDLPAAVWRGVADLPLIHRDPIDRLQVAHALESGLTLVTADRNIRRYPVDLV